LKQLHIPDLSLPFTSTPPPFKESSVVADTKVLTYCEKNYGCWIRGGVFFYVSYFSLYKNDFYSQNNEGQELQCLT
jgi:hypothetical protein